MNTRERANAARAATREVRGFLQCNALDVEARVGFSRVESPTYPSGRFMTRTVIYADTSDVREQVIAAMRQRPGGLLRVIEVHRLDRDDARARYCAIAVVRSVPG